MTGIGTWSRRLSIRKHDRRGGSRAIFADLPGNGGIARGPMAALHKFNPVRLAYIRDRAAAHFGRDPTRLDSLAGLRMLDIGCGGGIFPNR